MMRKLYDNITAPDSVAVMSLNGALLGYVPRRHIHRFVHDTNFGHVYAINQDAAGLWRLTVSANCTKDSGQRFIRCRKLRKSCLYARQTGVCPHLSRHGILHQEQVIA